MKSTPCLRLQRHGGLGQLDPVQPGLAMHMFGRHQIARQGPVAARKDRHVGPARQFADDAGVHLRQGQRHVAGDRDDAQDLAVPDEASASRMATASS